MGRKLNLGAARNARPHSDGWVNVDLKPSPGIDLLMDAGKKWVFPSDYFEYIYASHVLEHLKDGDALDVCMDEASRTLQPNGIFEIFVPYGPIGISDINDEVHHNIAFAPTSLRPYCQSNGQNTSNDYTHDKPLFKLEKVEVIRIFWQRERLEKFLGKWVSKRYTRLKIGIPVEIHWVLKKC